MATVLDVVSGALRLIGVYSSGQVLPSHELNDAISSLNQMLGSWSTSIQLQNTTQENFTLTASQATYTWGTGANFNSARPSRVIQAWVRVSGVDYPMVPDSKFDYNEEGLKTNTGIPTLFAVDNAYPNANVKLYPAPDSGYTIYFESVKPFTSYSSGSTTVSLPPAYIRAMRYALAIELAPEYGVQPPEAVIKNAQSAVNSLKRNNMQQPVAKFDLPMASGSGSSFDYRRG